MDEADTSEIQPSRRFENLTSVGQLDLPIFKRSYSDFESADLTVNLDKNHQLAEGFNYYRMLQQSFGDLANTT